jgi:ribonuclease P protein component
VVVPGRLAIAVVRNRMRRRVFSAIRKLNISCFAVDVVVFPGMKAKNACFVDILASLQGIFEKL